MTHVSIIGTGNMGQAISSIVTKGGNTVEVLGQSDADKPIDRRHRRSRRPLPGGGRRHRPARRPARRQGRRRHHQPAELRDLRLPGRPGRRLGRRRDRRRAAPVARPEGVQHHLRGHPGVRHRRTPSRPPSSSPATTRTPSRCWPASSPPADCAPSTPAPCAGPVSSRPSASCSSPSPPPRRSPGPAASASSPDRPPSSSRAEPTRENYIYTCSRTRLKRDPVREAVRSRAFGYWRNSRWNTYLAMCCARWLPTTSAVRKCRPLHIRALIAARFRAPGVLVVPGLCRSHRRDEQVDAVGAEHLRDRARDGADCGVEAAGVVGVGRVRDEAASTSASGSVAALPSSSPSWIAVMGRQNP